MSFNFNAYFTNYWTNTWHALILFERIFHGEIRYSHEILIFWHFFSYFCDIMGLSSAHACHVVRVRNVCIYNPFNIRPPHYHDYSLTHIPLLGIPFSESPLSSIAQWYPVGHLKGDSPADWTDVLHDSAVKHRDKGVLLYNKLSSLTLFNGTQGFNAISPSRQHPCKINENSLIHL